MINWYDFTPQDTLFFRGAEPAVMGESHTASMIFPPPAHTITGALRTAVLVQHDIDYKQYNAGVLPAGQEAIISVIGKSGEESPFSIVGPFFHGNGKIWIPCPCIWFAEKKEKASSKKKISISAPIGKTALLKTAAMENLYWAKGQELETMGGCWVSLDELCSPSEEKTILKNDDFFTKENHTGIALDVNNSRRSARKSHLYSFVHARLHEGVSLVFGVTQKLPLQERGILKLGAEQRFGEYRLLSNIDLPKGNSGLFMTLSILPADEQANQHCIASGRPHYYGGWDMHKGFHKPMKGYFPAGSVFQKQINHNCIEL
jgi:CRISPR-associated protein Cmr3